MKTLSRIKKKSSPKPPNPHESWHVFHVFRSCIDLYLINHSFLDHEYLTQQNNTTKFYGSAWALNFLWFIIHLLPQRYSSKVFRVSCNIGRCSFVNIISSIKWARFISWGKRTGTVLKLPSMRTDGAGRVASGKHWKVHCFPSNVKADWSCDSVTRDTLKKAFGKPRTQKHLLLLYWLCQSIWLCRSQQTVENS